MGRPREHDEATARALLDAAEQTIESGGLAALTIRGVADQVGTSTRAVYSLFGSRDGLLVALGARGFESLAAALRALPETDDPAADLVETAVSVFRPWVVRHPVVFRLGMQGIDPPELDAQFRPSRVAAGEALAARVERLDQADLLGGRSVQESVAAFDAFCEGLAELELRGNLPAGEEDLRWRDALSALLAGWRSVVHNPSKRGTAFTPFPTSARRGRLRSTGGRATSR